jgi:hypothetical protein
VRREIALWLCALIGVFAFAATAIGGNGAPSGAHYNLNIIGVDNPKTADMTDTSGHTIFVSLQGRSMIWLCESGVDTRCDNQGFYVVDRNATDNDGALFALPNPDPDGDGTTVYSVFARALGTPGGGADMNTCIQDPDLPGGLLYVYADVDGDGTVDRVPLVRQAHRELPLVLRQQWPQARPAPVLRVRVDGATRSERPDD